MQTGKTSESAEQLDDLSAIEEIAYPAGYAGGLAPTQLAYVAALNGIPSPDPAGPYSYCELGCGSGRTTIVLAGANPNSRFLGIDLSTQHIETARSLVKAAELDNIEFLAADISSLDLDALPEFDFITLHGLFAWVSDDVRRAILRFIDAKLRPGGMATVSYNALPGWSAVAPIREYFLEREPFVEGDPVEKGQTILDELEALRLAKATFFTANASAGIILEAIRQQDPRYVVHEFFSPDWRPLGFREVAKMLGDIGLEYVGDSRTVENLPEHSVPPAFQATLAAVEGKIERQVLKDFITNRFFRSDVYHRPDPGLRAIPSRDALLGGVRLGMERTPAEIGNEIDVVGANVRVEGTAVEVLQQILIHENRRMDEIVTHPAFEALDPASLRDAMLALTIERGLVPCARPTIDFDVVDSGVRPVPQINRVLLQEPARGHIVLSCPVTGAGLTLHAIEASLLLGLCSNDPVAVALAEIDRRGIVLSQGEQRIPEDRRVDAIAPMLESFAANKLGVLYALGMIVESS